MDSEIVEENQSKENRTREALLHAEWELFWLKWNAVHSDKASTAEQTDSIWLFVSLLSWMTATGCYLCTIVCRRFPFLLDWHIYNSNKSLCSEVHTGTIIKRISLWFSCTAITLSFTKLHTHTHTHADGFMSTCTCWWSQSFTLMQKHTDKD